MLPEPSEPTVSDAELAVSIVWPDVVVELGREEDSCVSVLDIGDMRFEFSLTIPLPLLLPPVGTLLLFSPGIEACPLLVPLTAGLEGLLGTEDMLPAVI